MALSMQYDHLVQHSATNRVRSFFGKSNPRDLELQQFVDIFADVKATPESKIDKGLDSLVNRFNGFLTNNPRIAKKIQSAENSQALSAEQSVEAKLTAPVPFSKGHFSARMAGKMLKKIHEYCQDSTNLFSGCTAQVNTKMSSIKQKLLVADLEHFGKQDLNSLCPKFAGNIVISPNKNDEIQSAIEALKGKIAELKYPATKKPSQQLNVDVEVGRKSSYST